MRVFECQKSIDRAVTLPWRETHHPPRPAALVRQRCIESGVDMPTVSRWLGHQNGGALCMKTHGHLQVEHSANEPKLSHSRPTATPADATCSRTSTPLRNGEAGRLVAPARTCVKTPGAKSVNDPFFVLRQLEWPNLASQWSKNEFSHSLAPRRTRPSRSGCNRAPSCAGSPSLGLGGLREDSRAVLSKSKRMKTLQKTIIV